MLKTILHTLLIAFLFSTSATAKRPFALSEYNYQTEDAPSLEATTALNTDTAKLMISGLFSTGNNTVRGIEFYAVQDIFDLGRYTVGVNNSGSGSEGIEFFLPGDTALAGEFVYVDLFPQPFGDYFGFLSDGTLTGNQDAISDGTNAVELFREPRGLDKDRVLIDVYGSVFENGRGKPWDFRDSWVYRKNGSLPSDTFNINDWRIPGPGILKGTSTNAEAPVPFPIGTYGQPYDDVPPDARCQDIDFRARFNNTSVDPDLIGSTSTDNTGVTLLISEGAIYSCADAGPNEELLTVYDAAGNKDTCTATINITSIPSEIFCQDVTVNLSFDGEIEVKAIDILDSLSGTCWGEASQFLLSTTNPLNTGSGTFMGETTLDSPRDSLVEGEVLLYEVFTFTAPADGFYLPTFSFSAMEEEPLIAIISTDSIIPNSGNVEDRAGFLDAFVYEAPGTFVASFEGESSVFLAANSTYYMQVATFNPIAFSGSIVEGFEAPETNQSITFSSDDLGTNTLYLLGIDDLGGVAVCQSTVTVKELNPFVTTWKTDNPGTSDSLQITIPIHEPSRWDYRFDIDWGDGTSITNRTTSTTHTYDSAGVYTVRITGNFPRIYFNNQGDKLKLLTVEQWGDTQWGSMENAFYGCDNLNITNPDIDEPDLSAVRSLAHMFDKCNAFNGDISQWDVSTIEHFDAMFSFCINFNQDIGDWEMGNAKTLTYMLEETHQFDQDLNDWDVSNVTDMEGLFYYAEVFNQDLNSWDVSKVTNMVEMFYVAELFNGDISSWNVSNVEDMEGMFGSAYAFNQDISKWDVSKVKDLSEMFSDAHTFNQDISSWKVSNTTDMGSMFNGAYDFNQDISTWDVSQVTDMRGMFRQADSFNQDISGWKVGNVTRMDGMFKLNDIFNQDISAWDVSKVLEMDEMFEDAVSFNQDLGNWDLGSIREFASNSGLEDMFTNSGLSVSNYDATLIGWNTDTSGLADDGIDDIPLNIQFDAINIQYCEADSARQNLIDNYGWTISDAGQNCLTVNVDEIEFGRKIMMYPNPAREYINFTGNLRAVKGIEIYDLSGQKVTGIYQDFDNLNISQLSPGVYLVRLFADSSFKTFKLVKE